MKKPDEIKKVLECCFNAAQCRDCPYYPTSCDRELVRDAREYIRQLEAEVNKFEEGYDALTKIVKRLEAERDAAVEDLEAYITVKCFACKHHEAEMNDAPCNDCGFLGKGNHDRFEWRGVQKEE